MQTKDRVPRSLLLCMAKKAEEKERCFAEQAPEAFALKPGERLKWGLKMIYFTVIRVQNFNPESVDEVPDEGVVISARAFRGALTTMIREFNHLVLNNGFKPHIWAVLYLSPKEPELGDTVKKDHFLTLKDLKELCK